MDIKKGHNADNEWKEIEEIMARRKENIEAARKSSRQAKILAVVALIVNLLRVILKSVGIL
ncbi:MAG TPA: hypothetical protein H9968_03035 [Candidatus Anaerobutyricum stercoris]|uniref:Uncharacterized protein n=1 Tax=Candidatus Anaerobutyricum stercoris TaxID=2838457 RepID=A0A9D2J7V3_9FIRM|nr:hypothetical protein [Candidatus Anaerobutyricum stercoris]